MKEQLHVFLNLCIPAGVCFYIFMVYKFRLPNPLRISPQNRLNNIVLLLAIDFKKLFGKQNEKYFLNKIRCFGEQNVINVRFIQNKANNNDLPLILIFNQFNMVTTKFDICISVVKCCYRCAT